MTEDARTVPAGTDVRLSAPAFPPNPALLDRLRTYVRHHHRVGAVYVFGMQQGADPPADVVAATLPDGDVGDHAVEITDLQLAVVDVLPSDATVHLTVLGPRAELDVLAAATLHVPATGDDVDDDPLRPSAPAPRPDVPDEADAP